MTQPDDTRGRLLEAAGREFAAKGFESATVREICRVAGANLAAVNYHFGDKAQLYVAAVSEAHQGGPPWPAETEGEAGPPADQLRLYVRHFLQHVLAIEQRETWRTALMMREMLNPGEAADALVRDTIRPRYQRLLAILRRICPEADDRRLDAMAMSVVGQCLQYKMARPIAERILGAERFAALNDLDFLAGHIAGFTLAALGQAPPLDRRGLPTPGPEATEPDAPPDPAPAGRRTRR